jgi:hypothetical protein
VNDCYQISSAVNSNVSGSYYKQSATVYSRFDLQLYLYLYSDAQLNVFWAVGPTVGSPLAYMTSNDVSTFPPTRWLTYKTTSFVPDNVVFTSTCPIVDNNCSSVEFFDTNGASVYGAAFIYNTYPQVYAGRAVYYLQAGTVQLYLYFYASTNNPTGIWIVGATIGQLNGILYTTSQATIPTGSGVQWLDSTGNPPSTSLTLQCQSALITAV